MNCLIKLLLFLLFCLSIKATDQFHIKGVQDIKSMTLRTDGSFDVICLDGAIEVRSSDQISQGHVCTHFKNISKSYELFHGGILGGFRFCDMDVDAKLSGETLWSIALNFSGTCSGLSSQFSCSGKSNECQGTISGDSYGINYTGGILELKNISKKVSGLYRPSSDTYGDQFVSIKPYYGNENVPHILTIDFNENLWIPICLPSDEELSMQLARVVCRQTDKQLYDYKSFDNIYDQRIQPISKICDGRESKISNCLSDSFFCDSGKIIQVYCK